MTRMTPAGGFFRAFTSTMSFLFSSCRACSAARRAGRASSAYRGSVSGGSGAPYVRLKVTL